MSRECFRPEAPKCNSLRRAVPPEVRTQYVAIIDETLEGADLNTVSVKQVRHAIQSKVQYDITPHKTSIAELVRERFEVVAAKLKDAEEALPSVETDAAPAVNGNGVHKYKEESAAPSTSASSAIKRAATSESLSDVVDTAPPKKKRKASPEDDATLAARLQAEEDQMARPTRGGNSRKTAVSKKKRTPKKKSAKTVGSDDSDVDGVEKPKKNTGFHKPLNLSAPLAALLGDSQLSRPEVTKRLWKHIKGNNLQDPADKRYIQCDEPMRSVFKQDRVHMFTMTKLASEQMYAIEES
ncbi:Upstream activation factor subunit spp27 [Cyphellophora attinorum]|uniref:Upstream activation factor subunit spp27 n=1 Tax=Cyphellophora attinorum TaxID=1664694 RepID=A0A0N1HXZ2_9EURO|nr:Upstream activation factor subunit spp27 [Phialophora attinorum]KPI45585.1 Upstream activation factor subunit spp27 [Phialophora attinorum]